MEQILMELLKVINSPDTAPSTTGWAKARFEEVLAKDKEIIKQ